MKFLIKNKFRLIAFAFAIATVASCDDYLDINDPQNDPTPQQVTPDLVLAGALSRTYSTQVNTMNRLGNVFMNNWGANVNSFTGGFNEEYQLVITSTFYNTIWDQLYIRVGNFQTMIDTPQENYENHIAIAKIMKSYYMQYLVDLYGDVPYTEAFQGGENLTPAYDDAQSIYRSLIVEINEAIDLFDEAGDLTQVVGTEDIVYGGDLDQWKRFANTLKLRILLREATKAETDGETSSYLDEQFDDLDEDFITDNATLNPGYAQDQDRQNPFYGSYINVDETFTTTYRFIRASKYAQEYLDGTLTGVFDPRIDRIYEPIDEDQGVVGVEQGIDSNSDDVPDDISPLGDGLLKSDAQDGILFSASESFFLQSEAALRGYIDGDAKDLFENGIEASFEYLFGEDLSTEFDDYSIQSGSADEITWDGSSNKIEAIMTQKWIATNGINAIESWIEYTRTGFPEIPLAINAQRDSKPNRLLYPSSEFIGNSANVPAQESNDAFNTFIFWDSTQN